MKNKEVPSQIEQKDLEAILSVGTLIKKDLIFEKRLIGSEILIRCYKQETPTWAIYSKKGELLEFYGYEKSENSKS